MLQFLKGLIGLGVADSSTAGQLSAVGLGKSVRDALIAGGACAAVILIDQLTGGGIAIENERVKWAVEAAIAMGAFAALRRFLVPYLPNVKK